MKSFWAQLSMALSENKTLFIAIMLAGSLIMIGWISLDKLGEVFNGQRALQTRTDLEQEISGIALQYRDAEPVALQTNLAKADQLLIRDFTHLTQWAQTLQEQGERLALHMYYQIQKPQPASPPIEGVTILPLELHLTSSQEGSGYRDFLQFLQGLEQSGPRIDIQEITINGDGIKATHFTVGLTTWMKAHDSVSL